MLKRNKKLSVAIATIMCVVAIGGVSLYAERTVLADEAVVADETPIKVITEDGLDGYTSVKTEKYKNREDRVTWDATKVPKELNRNENYYTYYSNGFYFKVTDKIKKEVCVDGYSSSVNRESVIFPEELTVSDRDTNVSTTYKVTGVEVSYSAGNLKYMKIPGTATYLNSLSSPNMKFTQIDFGENVKFNPDGGYVCYRHKNLKRVNLPEATTAIPERQFGECYNLSALIIPKNVTSIGLSAVNFSDDGSKVANIVMLGDNLENISSTVWPKYNTTIWTQSVDVYNKISYYIYDDINYKDYYYHTGVNVKIGRPYIEGYWDYGTYTDDNTDNAEVTIYGVTFKRTGENTVKIIGHNYKLEKYYLNNKGNISIDNTILVDNNRYEVTSIDKGVFDDVNANFEVSTQQAKDMLIDSGVPESKILYNSTIWMGFDTNIDGITYERSSDNTVRVKQSYDNRENIKIPEKIFVDNKEYYVTEIRQDAFRDCINLKNISLPNTITSIKDAAFFNCSSLTNLKLPEGLSEIRNGAFQYCNGLTDVIIPGGVSAIRGSAFQGCSQLENVTLENGVNEIDPDAFRDCIKLKNIILPNTVTSIKDTAFYNCKSLTSLELPESLTEIRDGAFMFCEGLEEVTIPDSVTTIGNNAFLGVANATFKVSSENVKNLLINSGVSESQIVFE